MFLFNYWKLLVLDLVETYSLEVGPYRNEPPQVSYTVLFANFKLK